MRWALIGARALVAAGALSLLADAAAQEPLPPLLPPGEAPAPPPARRKPPSVPFAADREGGVDLLRAPTLPSSWAEGATKAAVPGDALPPLRPAPPAPVAIAPAPVAAPAPAAIAPPAAAPPPAAIAAPVPVTVTRPEANVTPAPPKKRTTLILWAEASAHKPEALAGPARKWPKAFVDPADMPPGLASHQLAADEESKAPLPLPGPLSVPALHQQISRAVGGLARDIQVSTLPDHRFVVHVRSASDQTEPELIQMLMKVPEVASQGASAPVRDGRLNGAAAAHPCLFGAARSCSASFTNFSITASSSARGGMPAVW